MLEQIKPSALKHKIGLFFSLFFAAVFLTSCQSSVTNFGINQDTTTTTEVEEVGTLPVKTGSAVGEVLGFGPTRIAFLVPRTAPGNGSAVAKQLRNAAELAVEDLGSSVMELVIKIWI